MRLAGRQQARGGLGQRRRDLGDHREGECLGGLAVDLGHQPSTAPAAHRSWARTRWASAISTACSVSAWTITLAPSGGRGASHALSVAITVRAASRAIAPPPHPCPRSTEPVGTVRVSSSAMPRDLARHRALLRARRQLRPRGVDDRHQRKPELLGEAHGSTGRSQCRRPERGLRRLSAAVLPDDAGLTVQSGERQQHAVVALALGRAAQPDGVGTAETQQVADADPVGTSGLEDGTPRGTLRTHRPRPAGQGRHGGGVDHDGQRSVHECPQVVVVDHGVDHALGREILRGLHPGGKGFAVQGVEDLGPQEGDPHRVTLPARGPGRRSPVTAQSPTRSAREIPTWPRRRCTLTSRWSATSPCSTRSPGGTWQPWVISLDPLHLVAGSASEVRARRPGWNRRSATTVRTSHPCPRLSCPCSGQGRGPFAGDPEDQPSAPGSRWCS